MGARLIFAGTPEFAATILAALLEASYPPVAVYTQPDRPAGRGRRPRSSPVKQLALANGIPVEQPDTLRDGGTLRRLAEWRLDLMVVAAYGLLLPEAVLAIPELGCVNVHASLLPRWRGASPIQHAILAGDDETGISIMQMDLGLDTGPVLATATCPIRDDDTAGSLHERLAELGAGTLVETLPLLLAGRLTPAPQNDAEATYAGRIDKRDGVLDWNRPAELLARQVRAFNPWPVAYASLPSRGVREGACDGGGERLRVWRATVVEAGGDARPGTVLASGRSGIDVATGTGALRILTLQEPGGRVMTAAEYLNAHELPEGTKLCGGTAESA